MWKIFRSVSISNKKRLLAQIFYKNCRIQNDTFKIEL
jgi:hypothetical protein